LNPANRTVTCNGFTADWLVTHLNRNFPQKWIDHKHSTQQAVLGVELVIPVDHYQKSMRSVKYAILFIARIDHLKHWSGLQNFFYLFFNAQLK
jgi:inner membrane protein